MTYQDEMILKKREALKKEKYKTLENGIYMDGKILRFARWEIPDVLSIMVPDEMGEMPEAYARVKYPSEFRPQMILTTPDLAVNMGFTVFPNQIRSDDMMELLRHMHAAIHRANPDYRMNPCRILPKIEGCYFNFRSHAMDNGIYNMMLLVLVGKKLIQGVFNCNDRDYAKWEKVVLMMWETIREAGQEEE